MKHFRFTAYILVCLILSTLVALSAFAHQGKTDGNGGHYDSSTGSYHYHHGYPAHQHTFGRCPYGYDDKTDHSSGSSGNSSDKSYKRSDRFYKRSETTTAETEADTVTTEPSEDSSEKNVSSQKIPNSQKSEAKGNFFTDWNVSFGDAIFKIFGIIILLAICAWMSLFVSYIIAALIIDGINSIKKRRYPPKRLTERTEKVIIVIAFVVCFSLGVFFSYLYFK